MLSKTFFAIRAHGNKLNVEVYACIKNTFYYFSKVKTTQTPFYRKFHLNSEAKTFNTLKKRIIFGYSNKNICANKVVQKIEFPKYSIKKRYPNLNIKKIMKY
jgi:hypothetical protein